jgi:hypothetical protein
MPLRNVPGSRTDDQMVEFKIRDQSHSREMFNEGSIGGFQFMLVISIKYGDKYT